MISAFAGVVRLDGAPAALDEAPAMAGAFAAPPRRRPLVYAEGPASFAGVALAFSAPARPGSGGRLVWRDGGDAALLFAGRLDHRADIAAALNLAADRLATLSDGQLALAAWRRWGADGLARLTGAWTLAVWEPAERRLTLARDPMGGRSLFFHRAGAVVSFASAITALLRLERVGRDLDEVVLGDLLLLTLGERDRTAYREIQRVPGGHYVVFTPGRQAVVPFWHPPVDGPPLRLARDEDYVEAMRELLDRAVAACLPETGPVAVLGTGGLDSAGVSATAARLRAPGAVHHYCRVPPAGWQGPVDTYLYPDERPKLEALAARHANIRVVAVDEPGLHLVDLDPRCLFQRYGGPSIAAGNLGWYLGAIDRGRAEGHRVFLTGDFGNSGFSAPGRSAPFELLCGLKLGALAQELAGWRRRYGWSWPRTVKNTLLPRLQPPGLHIWRQNRKAPGGRRWLGWSLVNPAFVAEAGLEERARRLGGTSSAEPSRAPRVARAQILGWMGRLGGDLVAQTMAVDGFDLRAPLADLRLIEFTLQLPGTQFCRDGVMRWLARRTLADRLPAEIVEERRLGAQNPEWYQRLSQGHATDLADLPHIARDPVARRLLDLGRAARELADWPADADAAHGRLDEVRHALVRGLNVARFIRWNRGGNE